MLIDNQNRLELESKVLAAAFKQGIDYNDLAGANLAHKALFRLLRERHRMFGANPVQDSLSPMPLGPAWVTSPSIDKPNQASTEQQTASFAPDNGHSRESSLADNGEATLLSKNDLESSKLFPKSPPCINVYELLAIPPSASLEFIRKNFLKQVRKVLVTKTKIEGAYPHGSLEMLQNLWIAHDILTDSSIRADYDLNVLGLAIANPDRSKWKEPEPIVDARDAAALRIGELLRTAGLIDQTELEIACDMHKAMREMPFGRFLLKQDFIEEEQLEAVLLGQRILREGLIDLDQFQQAMEVFTQSSKDLDQILVQNGFLSPSDLSKINDLIRSEQEPLPKTNAAGEANLADESGTDSRIINIAISEFEEPS